MQSTPHKYDKRLCGLFCDGKQNKFKISPCCLRTKSCHLLSFFTREEERLRRYIYDFLQQGLIENES